MPIKSIAHFFDQLFGLDHTAVIFCLDIINHLVFPGTESKRLKMDRIDSQGVYAMDNISKDFKGKAMEVFQLSLSGLTVDLIGDKLELSKSSVYTLKKRVKLIFLSTSRYYFTQNLSFMNVFDD